MFKEKRHPAICPNCGNQMVGMNKYIVLKDNILVWYVCPRRKANGENGCGHKSPIQVNRIEGVLDKSNPMIFEGTVKTYAKQTFVLDDNDESIYGWIHKLSRDWEGKRIRLLVEKVEPDKIEGKNKTTEAILGREKLGSTAIGEGVAIPHAKNACVKEKAIIFGRSKNGIDFNSVDGKPVKLFFTIVSPDREAGPHLKMLARISREVKNNV